MLEGMIAAIVLFTLALAFAFAYGVRYNQRLVSTVVAAVEGAFPPLRKEYVPMGQGVVYGFEYELAGPLPSLKGIITTLPRYKPLYLPIAYLIGRNDLLKLTFECPGVLPPGVAVLVHETARGSRWQAVENDAEWHQEEIVEGAHRYRLYSFNPLVGGQMRALIPRLAPIEGFNQLSIDSRRGSLTVFLTPRSETIVHDLSILSDVLNSLTAPPTRVIVN
jgi:hypothetical protein